MMYGTISTQKKTMFGTSLLPYGVSGIHFCIFIRILCPRPYSYQIMFMSFKSNTTGITSEAGTTNPYGAHEFISGY